MRKELPEKYYLQHFQEFLSHLEQSSGHLFRQVDREFLKGFSDLNEPEQCLLVRMLNRASPCIKKASLMNYGEIPEPEQVLSTLMTLEFASPINEATVIDWLNALTKPELQQLIQIPSATNPPVKSAKKGKWVEWAYGLNSDALLAHPLTQEYVVHTQHQCLSYLLFLYFGNLNGKLNQFSMRDLGVLSTQKSGTTEQARFESIEEACSCFDYRVILKNINDGLFVSALVEDFQQNNLPPVVGEQAATLANKTLFYLGESQKQSNPQLAAEIWQASEDPRAIERRIRFLYQQGDKETVREQLENIIDSPDSEGLLYFAQDFLDRKYNKKRTSVLTDLLREHTPIPLDEAYTGFVEQGLITHYSKQGFRAFHTENIIWRALFGLVFWELLYLNPKAGRHSEFDLTPRCLKDNTFYKTFTAEITQLLDSFTRPEDLTKHLLKQFTLHHGTPNSLFPWHRDLTTLLSLMVTHSPLESLKQHLLNMSQRYSELSDGYPDLMIITDKGSRWVEVKAPGDQLRRNQLITLRSLKASGFDVQVQAAEWRFNPEQTYCVVDIETTGGGSDQHRITEVGIVKVQQGEIVDEWQSLINPQRRIPKYITELTGIDDTMVKDAPTFSQVADQILEFTEGSIFVAHNVGFDYGFFRQEFSRLEINYKSPKLCTVKLARQYFPGLASYSLGKLCNDLDIQLDNHHRAMADAKAAADILLMVNEQREAQPTD